MLTVYSTLGLPQLTACVLSQSTLLRLQVALKANCPKWPLCCMHFPGLSCPGSGFLGYSTKAQTWLGLRFVPFPGLSSSGDQVLGEHTLPKWGGESYRLPNPSRSVSQVHHLRCAVCLLWGFDLWLQPSWWMSTVQDPRKT